MLTALLCPTYLDAVDYLDRMKAEKKFNESSIAVFAALYPAEIDSLVRQGYFKPENN